jgi:integrase/recombinase XerD
MDGKPHRLSTASISLVLKTAADKARQNCNDVPDNVHCHLIRKTKAMDLYKNGVLLPFIIQLLGHESMSTASGFYVFATLEMMNEAMNKAAPNFGDSDKVWNQEAVRKAIYSLD